MRGTLHVGGNWTGDQPPEPPGPTGKTTAWLECLCLRRNKKHPERLVDAAVQLAQDPSGCLTFLTCRLVCRWVAAKIRLFSELCKFLAENRFKAF